MDELFREEDPPGLRDGDGGRPEVALEQATELPRSDPEALCEVFHAGVVPIELPVGDEGEPARDRVRGASPRAVLGSGLRPAAEAGAEAGFLRGGSGGKEPAVLALREAPPCRPVGNRSRWS